MKGNMVIALVIIGIIGLAIVGFALVFFGLYNTLVGLDVNTQTKLADVEAFYQRRADLIPSLVNATKGYMGFEKQVLEDVTNARSQWMNARTPDDKVTASDSLDSAISRLLLVYENYPQLKSDTVVHDLMVELEGTENRIASGRMDYNTAVQGYNTAIRSFPTNIIAGMYGFTAKQFFASKPGSDVAPNVNITI
jgi:LemA protein